MVGASVRDLPHFSARISPEIRKRNGTRSGNIFEVLRLAPVDKYSSRDEISSRFSDWRPLTSSRDEISSDSDEADTSLDMGDKSSDFEAVRLYVPNLNRHDCSISITLLLPEF